MVCDETERERVINITGISEAWTCCLTWFIHRIPQGEKSMRRQVPAALSTVTKYGQLHASLFQTGQQQVTSFTALYVFSCFLLCFGQSLYAPWLVRREKHLTATLNLDVNYHEKWNSESSNWRLKIQRCDLMQMQCSTLTDHSSRIHG